MKILNKIYDFFIDYEDILKFIFIMFIIMCGLFYFTYYCDKQLTREKSIIEKTKDYVEYKNCKYLNEVWYCWNE